MMRLIRWLLGLCPHTDREFIGIEPVLYKGDEGPILALDLAKSKTVKHYVNHVFCHQCKTILRIKVK